jgi:hypothetical protein
MDGIVAMNGWDVSDLILRPPTSNTARSNGSSVGLALRQAIDTPPLDGFGYAKSRTLGAPPDEVTWDEMAFSPLS